MRISIVTPTFNDGRFLRGAIESVSSQTHRDFEHIVIDGGSTDGTLDMLRGLPRVQWISEPDRGIYDAINKGLRMASGEVLAFLNADDRYPPHALRTVAQAFDASPAVDFVYGSIELMDQAERPLGVLRPLDYAWMKRSRRLIWPQPTCFWRRRVHERIGFFDPGIRFVGDMEFFRRMMASDLQGERIPATLARFMLRPDSLSFSKEDLLAGREVRAAIEAKYGARRWTPGRIAGELAFASLNIPTYPARIRFRWWERKALHAAGMPAASKGPSGSR
jgi:glycosyltransferase involved in cell wall biosynthesis